MFVVFHACIIVYVWYAYACCMYVYGTEAHAVVRGQRVSCEVHRARMAADDPPDSPTSPPGRPARRDPSPLPAPLPTMGTGNSKVLFA
jgi:hypothetical protein